MIALAVITAVTYIISFSDIISMRDAQYGFFFQKNLFFAHWQPESNFRGAGMSLLYQGM